MSNENDTSYTITPKGRRFAGLRANILEPTQSNILGLAWLAEMASVGCDLRGMHRWAEDLRADACRLRAQAVNI